jgi:hypothetical protein
VHAPPEHPAFFAIQILVIEHVVRTGCANNLLSVSERAEPKEIIKLVIMGLRMGVLVCEFGFRHLLLLLGEFYCVCASYVCVHMHLFIAFYPDGFTFQASRTPL